MTWNFPFDNKELTINKEDFILFYDRPLITTAHSESTDEHYIILDCNEDEEKEYIIVGKASTEEDLQVFFEPDVDFKETLKNFSLTLIVFTKNLPLEGTEDEVEEMPILWEDIPHSWFPDFTTIT